MQKQQRRLRRLFILRKIPLNPLLLFTTKRWICQNHIHPLALADIRQLKAQRVARINLRRIKSVQQQIHLAQQIRQCLRFAAEQRFFLQHAAVRHRLHLFRKVIICFDQEPTRASRRIKNRFAQARIGYSNHQPHHRARSIKLTRIPRRIPHLPQHRFIKRAQRVQLIARGEVNAVELVNHISQKVAADHPILDPFKNRTNDIAPVIAVRTGQHPKIAK